MLTLSSVLLIVFIINQVSIEIVLEWEVCARGVKVPFLIVLDFIRVLFLSTVLIISGSVFFYRSGYMMLDKFNSRFSIIVLRFVFRICLIIIRPRIVRILLGWDGLGVTSYLLVCYYIRNKSFNARILTAITNRLGDIGILLTISFWISVGMFNFGLFNSSLISEGTVFLLIIILARITKRAQIPFSAWLPAAMAAPTPVSALVHSSTLVTAGVYLLVRFNLFLEWGGLRNFLLGVGLITTTIAGVSALFELDIKKVIALSTLRQLGIIFFSLGISYPFLAFFHLVSHAYFKAMLFICAGAIIHRVKDYQDFRKIGSRGFRTKFLSSFILVANIRLCGLPFLSGFYSKDLILEVVFCGNIKIVYFFLVVIATLITLFYSIRFSLFIIEVVSVRESFSAERDVRRVLLLGPRVLIFPSIIGGYFLRGLLPSPELIIMPVWEKILIISLIFLVGGYLVLVPLFGSLSRIFGVGASLMWFMPVVIRPNMVVSCLTTRKNFLKGVDISWIRFILWGWVVGWLKINFYLSSIFRSLFIRRILFIILFLFVF